MTGLSALPGTTQYLAATRAMSRFLNHDDIPFHALIEPAQDAIHSALGRRRGRFVLVVHDWCMFDFNAHTPKRDRYVRYHDADLGYESGNVLVVNAVDGRPIGPVEFRLRTAVGMLSTRVGGAAYRRGMSRSSTCWPRRADGAWAASRSTSSTARPTRSAITAASIPPSTGSSSASTTSDTDP